MNIKNSVEKAKTGGRNIISMGLGAIPGEIKKLLNDETASMEDKVISLTVILVIIAVVLIPVGYTTYKSTNLTTTITNGNVTTTILPSATEQVIFNVIPLLVLVAIILGIITLFKKGNN